jgi:hypothetical protein
MLASQKAANGLNNLTSPANKKNLERDYKAPQMIILRIKIFRVPTEKQFPFLTRSPANGTGDSYLTLCHRAPLNIDIVHFDNLFFYLKNSCKYLCNKCICIFFRRSTKILLCLNISQNSLSMH